MGIFGRVLLMVVGLVILVGCGQSTPVPSATPAPTTLPTTTALLTLPTAATTSVPTVVATAVPATATVAAGSMQLPAALYFLEAGQIHRIDPETLSRQQITAEVAARPELAPIGAFAITGDGRLAYKVDDLTADRLVLATVDGTEPQILFEQPEVQIGAMRWSPDGKQLAVRLGVIPPESADFQSGVYLFGRPGEPPHLVQADDPVADPINPSPEVRAYNPRAWAPDGSALLLDAFSPFYELCTPAIRDLDAAEAQRPAAPAELTAVCEDAGWSRDSRSVYVRLAPAEGQLAGAGLWLFARDGSMTELIERQREGIFQLIVAAEELQTNEIYYFFAAAGRLPGAFDTDPGLAFVMQRVAADGRRDRTPLRTDALVLPQEAHWAPDGSGAAVLAMRENQPRLNWLPVHSAAIVELPAMGFGVEQLRWGP